eukprot:761425-Hanusia_phi.AAC.4
MIRRRDDLARCGGSDSLDLPLDLAVIQIQHLYLGIRRIPVDQPPGRTGSVLVVFSTLANLRDTSNGEEEVEEEVGGYATSLARAHRHRRPCFSHLEGFYNQLVKKKWSLIDHPHPPRSPHSTGCWGQLGKENSTPSRRLENVAPDFLPPPTTPYHPLPTPTRLYQP